MSFEGDQGFTNLPGDYWFEVAGREREKNTAARHERRCGLGFGTVFVLDTSGSMAGGGFRQMKDLFTSILEEIPKYSDSRENVAVVIFGHTVKFAHYLSNDYESLKKCLDDTACYGSSPLLAGLILSTASFTGGGSAQIGNWHVRTRVIVMTDGRSTDSTVLNGPEDQKAYDMEKVNTQVIQFLHCIGRKHLISFIPVGEADMSFLEIMVGITHGFLVHPSNAKQLGRYTTHMRVAVLLKDRLSSGEFHLEAAKMAVEESMPSIKLEDQDMDTVTELISKKDIFRDIDEIEDGDDTTDTEEDLQFSVPVGTRVRRGPHWRWGNQDSDGPGTVIGHDEHGWAHVQWDNGKRYCYRYNLPSVNEYIFDIVECSEPRVLVDGEFIAVGCLVRRGPDWKWDDQDGNEVGTIYKVSSQGIVHVRWKNGIKSNYRFGFDGKFDVQLCDPFSYAPNSRLNTNTETSLSIEANTKSEAKAFPSKESSKYISEFSNIPWPPRKDAQITEQKLLEGTTDIDKDENCTTTISNAATHSRPETKNEYKYVGPQISKPDPHTDETELSDIYQTETDLEKSEKASYVTDNDVKNRLEMMPSPGEQTLERGAPRILEQSQIQEDYVWQWQDSGRKWRTYPDEIGEIINYRFRRNPDSTFSVQLNNQCFRINLSRCEQINTATNETAEIRRLYPLQADN